MKPSNVDLMENGGDHHKTWDIYPAPGESREQFVGYLLALWGKGRMTDSEAATKGLALPSAKGMPEDLRAELTKIAASVEDTDSMDVEKRDRLNWSPKKNWVEEQGGLPKPIEEMALAIMRDHGKSRERAIPIAISQSKVLAAKGDPKYMRAIARWESMKAKQKMKDR